MKRFVWRLQKVLDIKTKEEQLKEMELFRLTEALAERQSELMMRQQALRELLGRVREDRSPHRLETQEFCLRHAAADDQAIAALRQDIHDLEGRRQEKTAEVLAAKRFREGLERLRDEAKEQFIREQEQLEQKEMDDRTSVVFARTDGMKWKSRTPDHNAPVRDGIRWELEL
jgi:flagellar biosynthesis chaperone FliJ